MLLQNLCFAKLLKLSFYNLTSWFFIIIDSVTIHRLFKSELSAGYSPDSHKSHTTWQCWGDLPVRADGAVHRYRHIRNEYINFSVCITMKHDAWWSQSYLTLMSVATAFDCVIVKRPNFFLTGAKKQKRNSDFMSQKLY